MKQQNNLKTPTPTEALDQAMSGLLKVGAPFLNEGPASSTPSEETQLTSQDRPEEFRESLMDGILAKNPGLTREKLSEQMDAMGF
jgi:hypothetical protein